MLRATLILLVVIAAGAATAQRYEVQARAGIGGVVSAPYTQLVVDVQRDDDRPFVGRLVADIGMQFGGRGRRGSGMYRAGDVQVAQDVALEEGARARRFMLEIPVNRGLDITVRLERQLGAGQYEIVATTEITPQFNMDERQLVGFVSSARLQLIQPYFFFQVVEIPIQEFPSGWKSLSGFDALIINDDRLSRAQTRAVEQYLTAGGTVILSPSSAGSFNPDRLAGSLLRIPPNPGTQSAELREFNLLLQPLRESGLGARGEPIQPDEDGNVHSADNRKLTTPPPESRLRLWTETGRAQGVPGYERLISIASVGAGNLVLLHTDISAGPFTAGNDAPTSSCANLLGLAMESIAQRGDGAPGQLLADSDMRNRVDIAGRRIPGRDVLIALLLVYVGVAGVGMFVVARRIRRPEFYPATLLLAALVSVGMVFGLGELFKRSGDRVKAVNIVVSDETTENNAVFTLGCSYAVDGGEYRFVNDHSAILQPARLEYPALTGRGGPADPLPHEIRHSGGETTTTVKDLVRWQNVFFLKRNPANLEGFTLKVEDVSGAFEVENTTSHELKGCIFIVGQAETTEAGWHYAPRLEASGSKDARITFSQSTRLADDADALAAMLSEDVGGDGYEFLRAMFDIDEDDAIGRARDFATLEGALYGAGLLPEDGEFLMISTLPEDALPRGWHGAQDVDDNEISHVNLWFVRGTVRAR